MNHPKKHFIFKIIVHVYCPLEPYVKVVMREKINLNTVTECTCTSGKEACLLIKTYLIPVNAIFIFTFYPRLLS